MCPLEHFKKEPLSALQHIRLASTLGTAIEPPIFEAICHPEVVQRVINLPREQMAAEFRTIMEGHFPDKGFALLLESTLMQQFLNAAVIGTEYEGKMAPWSMDQNNRYHTLTLEQHTIQTLKNSLALHKEASPEKQLVMRLTAICHDLGKMFINIHGSTKTGSVSYHGHEIHSAHLTELLLSYLHLDPFIPAVKPLVKHHMRPHFLVKTPTSRAIRNLLRNLREEGACWIDLLNQAEADKKGKTLEFGPDEEAYLIELNALRVKIQSHVEPDVI